jgi:hypothetical protein
MARATPRRVPVVAAVAVLLLAGGVADRAGRPALPADRGGPPPYVQPTAAPATAQSSTWYCAGATAAPDGRANGQLRLVNAGADTVTGRVTVVPGEGDARSVPVEVPGQGSVDVALADVVSAATAAALVELDGGQVAVELTVLGPDGADDQPCHAGASAEWYVPDGSTAKDATLTLALFNPFPDDAVVDLTFATEEGRVSPPAFRAVLVPAGRLTTVDVGKQVQRKNEVSTFAVARTGQLVVTALQLFDGSAGRRDLGLLPAAPATAERWVFPEGYVTDGIVERLSIANPSETETAEVDVDIVLDEGIAEPVTFEVPPQGRVTFSGNDPARVPARVGHSLGVRSVNGVGVVAARTLEAVGSHHRGLAMTLGSRLTAARWLFAAGGPSDGLDHWLVVQNPFAEPVTVSVTALADGRLLAVEGLQKVAVGAGRRAAFRLGDHVRRPALPLVVTATGPVVAERGLYRTGEAVGMSTALGVVLPEE